MKRNIVATLSFCALAMMASAALADVKTDAGSKIQYDVPAGFAETKSGSMTVYADSKEEMMFIVLPTTAKGQDAAMKELETAVDSIIKDIKPAKDPTRGTTNKLRNVQMKATGTYKGKPVNMTVRFYETPANTYFVVVGAYLAEKKESLKDAFNKFFASIKPAA